MSSAPALEPAPHPPSTAPRKAAWYDWRTWSASFLVISILVHLLFGLVAAYFIVETIQAKRKQTFAGPPSSNAPAHAMEHKVQLQKQKQTMSAPPAVKRITTTANSRIALPAVPDMPNMNTAVTPLSMAGTGTLGLSPGSLGGGGGPSGGGGGLAPSLFGSHSVGGLSGTFYDFKMQQNYTPVKGINLDVYGKIIKDVAAMHAPWVIDSKYPHYTSPAKLTGRYFIFPAIQDNLAGSSFQSPRSGPGIWLALYKGRFSAAAGGSFRFVGFGDNVMMVKVGDNMVLDASDHHYTGMGRQDAGNIAFPGKDVTPLYFGQWFDMSPGKAQELNVLVGDEGGTFCSGIFIQAKDTPYAQGDRGVPKLPIFALGTLSDADKALLGKALPDYCLTPSGFKNEDASSGGLFDR